MFVKIAIILALAAVGWTLTARPSEAHGDRVVYRVHAYDTLWSIAASHYAGDPREAVWRIQQANGLAGVTVRPGQKLVLP
jgi:LysM repeat protein